MSSDSGHSMIPRVEITNQAVGVRCVVSAEMSLQVLDVLICTRKPVSNAAQPLIHEPRSDTWGTTH